MKLLSNRRSKEMASLQHKKYRERLGQFVIEGVRSVEAAVLGGASLVDVVVQEDLQDDPAVRTILDALPADVPVYRAVDDDVAAISNVATPQGILAVANIDLLPTDHLTATSAILALDGVQDPGNVGTLIRTAAWFGIDVVLAGPGTAGFFNPKIVRAAMGGLWDVRLSQTDDLGGILDALQRAGFALYGADLAGTPATVWQSRRPAVLVVGSEAHGLSAAVLSRLHQRIAIPGAVGRAGTESLNVAIASGILLYEWLGRGAAS